MVALCKPFQVCFSAELTEVFALEHDILLAQELQLSRVIVEFNSLNAIQVINDGATKSSFGHLIQGILQVSNSFESCLFKHINKSFNSVAHELAQHAQRSSLQHLWKEVAPHFVTSFLQSDMNVI